MNATELKTVKITIEKSNLDEFPEDGSKKSRQRKLAFDFAVASLEIACEKDGN